MNMEAEKEKRCGAGEKNRRKLAGGEKKAVQMRGLAFQRRNSICIKRFMPSLGTSRGCRCSMLNANEN